LHPKNVANNGVARVAVCGGLPTGIQNDENTRDPEDRVIDEFCRPERKEKMMEQAIADSLRASGPPSSTPDPDEDFFGSPPLPEHWQ
jgi:hypothetical protein